MQRAVLYQIRGAAVTESSQGNERPHSSITAGIHPGFRRTQSQGKKAGRRSRHEIAASHVPNAGNRADHSHSAGVPIYSDLVYVSKGTG